MIKNLLLIIFLSFSSNLFAQREFEMTLIRNNNDTLELCALLSSNLFFKSKIDERSFLKNIYYKESGKTHKLSSANFKYLSFIDPSGRKRIFYKKSYNDILMLEDTFFEEVISGKLSWFRTVSSSFYDNAILYENYFLTKELGFMHVNKIKGFKSTLKNIIVIDKPELLKPLKDLDFSDWVYADDILIEFIKLYNK
jgi:hypothetical protein